MKVVVVVVEEEEEKWLRGKVLNGAGALNQSHRLEVGQAGEIVLILLEVEEEVVVAEDPEVVRTLYTVEAEGRVEVVVLVAIIIIVEIGVHHQGSRTEITEMMIIITMKNTIHACTESERMSGSAVRETGAVHP